jgi:hypothetical protein
MRAKENAAQCGHDGQLHAEPEAVHHELADDFPVDE